MTSRILSIAGAMTILLVVMLVTGPLLVAHADSSEPVRIRVEVNDGGFEGTSGEFTIEVTQGQLVELTFVWAHQGYVEEEHIMVLEGYDLEWEQIDFYNREATVRFIADRPGTFTFKCDLDCELHDYLQHGHLKVSRGGGGAEAPTFTPTTLSLTPSFWVTAGSPITLMAVLTDTQGIPVPKAQLRFFVDAGLGGTEGKMEFGRVRTDANGVALIDYQPTLGQPEHIITARFEGVGIYAESEQVIQVEEAGSPPPAYVTAPIGLERVRGWGPVVLAGAILAVWAVFLFVLYQALGIARVRPGG